MGSFFSCKRTKPKEKNTFKQKRLKLLEVLTFSLNLNTIIYEYAFENKGVLLFDVRINRKTLENISWFDGLKWNLIPPHPILSEMMSCGICVIEDHIVFLGGHETTKPNNYDYKFTPNQQIMYKYNYLDSKFTRLTDIPVPISNPEASFVKFGLYLFIFMKNSYFESTSNNMVYRYDILNNIWEIDYAFENTKTYPCDEHESDKFVVGDKLFIHVPVYNSLYCYENFKPENFKLYKVNIENLGIMHEFHYFTNFKNQLCRIDYYGHGFNRTENVVFYEVKGTELIETKRETTINGSWSDKSFGNVLNWDNYCHIEILRSSSVINFVDSNNIGNRVVACPIFPEYDHCKGMLLK